MPQGARERVVWPSEKLFFWFLGGGFSNSGASLLSCLRPISKCTADGALSKRQTCAVSIFGPLSLSLSRLSAELVFRQVKYY